MNEILQVGRSFHVLSEDIMPERVAGPNPRAGVLDRRSRRELPPHAIIQLLGYEYDPYVNSNMQIVLRRVIAFETRPTEMSWKGPYVEARQALLAMHSIDSPRLQSALTALEGGHAEKARIAALEYLEKHPNDADALNLLSEIACWLRDGKQAELYLAECVRCHPDHDVYRYNYAVLLFELGKWDEALVETEALLRRWPCNTIFRTLKAIILDKNQKYHDASLCYRKLVEEYPDCAELWFNFSSVLRSLAGHESECIAALRKAVSLCPWPGSYWWSLASLKTVRFDEADVQIMECQLERPAISPEDRANLHFALGKGHDDIRNYERSIRHYASGNAIRARDNHYQASLTTATASRTRAVFTREVLNRPEPAGSSSCAPIFVVGLQRSGSTLVEQILDSHSAIEGLGEPSFVFQIIREDLMPMLAKTQVEYPLGMETLELSRLRAMGERYLELAAQKRSTAKPFFVDKCSYNLWHVGLIHLILPNSKIIDVRRHPMACCHANFTMNFAYAPPVSYRLSDIGGFYADYVRLMDHFDRMLPGRILRVFYERLVTNFEDEVRRMLEFIGVPFETGCLEYYKNARDFNSYSNEQVRSPIFTEKLEHWRRYEPWLGSLKAALGPVLDAYPDVPAFS